MADWRKTNARSLEESEESAKNQRTNMEEKLLNQNKWKAKERKLLLGKLKRNQIQTVPKSRFFQQLAAQSVRRGRAVEWSCGRKN